MAHYDVDWTCQFCGEANSLHPCATERGLKCEYCGYVDGSEIEELSEDSEKLIGKNRSLNKLEPPKPGSLDKQVDGDHYKKYPIQPARYSYENKLGWIEGEIVKYVTRHRDKKGKIDLEKAIHLLEMLIELEYD